MNIKIFIVFILTSLLFFISIAKTETYSIRKVNFQDPISGKELFQNKCAKCHKLYEPTKFKKEKWRKMINKMQKRAKINDVEREKIYNYIMSNIN